MPNCFSCTHSLEDIGDANSKGIVEPIPLPGEFVFMKCHAVEVGFVKDIGQDTQTHSIQCVVEVRK